MQKIRWIWQLLRRRWISVLAICCFAFVVRLSLQGLDSGLLGVFGTMIWIFAGLIICIIAVHKSNRYPKEELRVIPGDWAVLAVCFSLSGAAVFTQWPLRTVFYLSRAELDRQAQGIEQGRKAKYPRLVGLFWVQQAEVSKYSNTVCFRLDLDPAGRTGLVQGGPGAAQSFNLWSHDQLAPDWQLISED